jgi:hypothetical protein
MTRQAGRTLAQLAYPLCTESDMQASIALGEKLPQSELTFSRNELKPFQVQLADPEMKTLAGDAHKRHHTVVEICELSMHTPQLWNHSQA